MNKNKFKKGDRVRNKKTGKILTIMGYSIWNNAIYYHFAKSSKTLIEDDIELVEPEKRNIRDVKIGDILVDATGREFDVTDIGTNGIAHDGRYYHTFEKLEEWGCKFKEEVPKEITEAIKLLESNGYKVDKE
jgi:hypothetical protein